MCFGGNNQATEAAQAQDAQRTATINNNVNQINKAFAGRQSQYDAYNAALSKSYESQLQTQQAQASRGLKFALARGGLTGSSVAAEQGGELQKEIGQGQLTASEQAQAKLAGLESSDTAEKQQLISLAQSGNNIGNAAQMTDNALKANLDNAQTALLPNSLGNIFGGVTNSVTNMNTAAQTRLGLRAAQAYANPFSNASSSNSGFTGGPG